MRHFSIFATSLTLDLEGVEFNPGNLVYLYYFVADSDIHIECESMDIFSADNPTYHDPRKRTVPYDHSGLQGATHCAFMGSTGILDGFALPGRNTNQSQK